MLRLLLFLPLVNCGTILVYSPSLSRSHLISNGRIADTLVDAGHKVVMFIPEYEEIGEFYGSKKAEIITLRNFSSRYTEEMESTAGDVFLTQERLSFAGRLYYEYMSTDMCQELMEQRHKFEHLREYKFDVAFSEQIDLCGVGVIRYLGVENHIWISTTPIMDAVSYNLGVPAPPSYVPTIEENDNGDVMDFWQRAFNLYMYIGSVIVHRLATDGSSKVFQKIVPNFPNIRDIVANSSLCFVNSDEILDFPRPIIHKTIYIGGLGVSKKTKPLDETFSRIMEKGKKGVVVFSLGSIVPFGSLQERVKLDLARAFSDLPDYHFVLKTSKDDNTTRALMSNITNVDITNWMPQVDLLAHPRLKLFVMHGGVNGLLEAALFGTPLIVIPYFADQFRNARLAEKRGVGRVIKKLELNYDTFYNSVKEVLDNDRYKKNAVRLADMMWDKPFTPKERLVQWTEFTIKHGVLHELHVEGSRLNTIVYFNLDVIFVAISVVFISLFLLLKAFKAIIKTSVVHKKKAE